MTLSPVGWRRIVMFLHAAAAVAYLYLVWRAGPLVAGVLIPGWALVAAVLTLFASRVLSDTGLRRLSSVLLPLGIVLAAGVFVPTARGWALTLDIALALAIAAPPFVAWTVARRLHFAPANAWAFHRAVPEHLVLAVAVVALAPFVWPEARLAEAGTATETPRHVQAHTGCYSVRLGDWRPARMPTCHPARGNATSKPGACSSAPATRRTRPHGSPSPGVESCYAGMMAITA